MQGDKYKDGSAVFPDGTTIEVVFGKRGYDYKAARRRKSADPSIRGWQEAWDNWDALMAQTKGGK